MAPALSGQVVDSATDLDVTVINASAGAGEILRELTIDLTRD